MWCLIVLIPDLCLFLTLVICTDLEKVKVAKIPSAKQVNITGGNRLAFQIVVQENKFAHFSKRI